MRTDAFWFLSLSFSPSFALTLLSRLLTLSTHTLDPHSIADSKKSSSPTLPSTPTVEVVSPSSSCTVSSNPRAVSSPVRRGVWRFGWLSRGEHKNKITFVMSTLFEGGRRERARLTFCLSFRRVRRGYQVYLGNTRGVFDMGHKTYDRGDPKFWGEWFLDPFSIRSRFFSTCRRGCR